MFLLSPSLRQKNEIHAYYYTVWQTQFKSSANIHVDLRRRNPTICAMKIQLSISSFRHTTPDERKTPMSENVEQEESFP